MGRKIFITATDTGSGKTYITARLISRLVARGVNALALKPVACGHEAGGLNGDVSALLRAQGFAAAQQVNCYSFKRAVSPNIAAAAEGADIESDKLVHWCEERARGFELCLIEGVGGLMVPLNGRYLVGDWIGELKPCEVLLVIGARLGAINHALLTMEQLARFGMAPRHIVINALEESYASDIERSIRPFLPDGCSLYRISADAAEEEFELLADGLLAIRP